MRMSSNHTNSCRVIYARALTQRDCQETNVSCVSRGLHTTDCVPLEAPPLQDGHCFDNLVTWSVLVDIEDCFSLSATINDANKQGTERGFEALNISKHEFYTTCWDFSKCQDASVPDSMWQKLRNKYSNNCVRVSCTLSNSIL